MKLNGLTPQGMIDRLKADFGDKAEDVAQLVRSQVTMYSGGGQSEKWSFWNNVACQIREERTEAQSREFDEQFRNDFPKMIKCTCPCHQPGGQDIKHVTACCDNGWVENFGFNVGKKGL